MEKNNMQIYNIDAFSKHVESCLAACISGLIHCDLKVVVIRPFTPFFIRVRPRATCRSTNTNAATDSSSFAE